MSLPRVDVIVAGLGAMGSATACHLALRGQRVLGVERWAPGHTFASWHGDTRIIREAYFEHPLYVPIVRRAYTLWRELEERSGMRLLHEIGGLMVGPPSGTLVSGVLRSAGEFGIPVETLSATDVRRRFPAFHLRADDVAVLDPRAGYLDPEACVAAHLAVARAHGADVRFNDALVNWTADGAGVRVTTTSGTYAADRLVLAVGARTPGLVPDLDLPLTVERQVLVWFGPDASDDHYDQAAFPIYLHEYAPAEICYGFPRMPRGVKAAVMHAGEPVSDPDVVRRTVDEDDIRPVRDALRSVLPELGRAPVVDTSVCLFTNTPNQDFLIDFHPGYEQVLISSACSGHGFKFASAIGELQADLVIDGRARFDRSPFTLASIRASRLRVPMSRAIN